MKILFILKESLRIIKEEPKLFIPRIFTTAFYTLFLLKVAKLVVLSQVSPGKEVLQGLVFLGLFSLLLLALDIITYGMYSVMAEDYHRGKEISLVRALKNALKQGKALLLLGIAAIIFLSISMIFILMPAALAIALNIPALALLSLLAALMAIVIFALIFFFAIPSAVIDRLGSLEALSLSYNLGMKNRKEVIGLNLFFSFLIIFTILVASATEMQGRAFTLALILFIAGRLIQALVYTYISVATPTAFLIVRTENGEDNS